MSFNRKKEIRLDIFNFLNDYITNNNMGGLLEISDQSENSKLIKVGDEYLTVIGKTFIDYNRVMFKVYHWILNPEITSDKKLTYILLEVPKLCFFINDHEDVYFMEDQKQSKTFFNDSDNSWLGKRFIYSIKGYLETYQMPDVNLTNSVL